MPYRVIQENVQKRFWAKVEKADGNGCWCWTGARSDFGHGEVRIGGVLYRAHRLAWEWQNGPIPDGMCVLHRCDVPSCVRAEHLFLGTKADNTADMMRKGRGKSGRHEGESSGTAKLTNENVAEIRRAYSAHEASQYQLAAKYGVSQGTIGFVIRRDTWKHV